VKVRDLSKAGVALLCWAQPDVGTTITIDLPDAGGPATATVVRVGGGVVAASFVSDPVTEERVERAYHALAQRKKAA
jgi:hypothetical protein